MLDFPTVSVDAGTKGFRLALEGSQTCPPDVERPFRKPGSRPSAQGMRLLDRQATMEPCKDCEERGSRVAVLRFELLAKINTCARVGRAGSARRTFRRCQRRVAYLIRLRIWGDACGGALYLPVSSTARAGSASVATHLTARAFSRAIASEWRLRGGSGAEITDLSGRSQANE
jgi:hypothetical protein